VGTTYHSATVSVVALHKDGGPYLRDAIVAGILQSEDDKHQQSAGNEFRKELASLGQESLWVCTEDGGGGLWCWRYCSKATLKIVDCRDVVGIHDATTHKPTKYLGNKVYWKPPPWELAEEAVAESNRRIQICSGVASDVYA
jgi:hypothetical protein